MSDAIKNRLLLVQMEARDILEAISNLSKASLESRYYCDQCCERFDEDFRLYDFMIQKEDYWADDHETPMPRSLCRGCFEERNTLPSDPAPEGRVWFTHVSPVMCCPKCKKQFANRYGRKHKGGLPVQGEAGKIICYECQREKERIRGPEGECDWCGKDFSRSRSDARFCSARCRVAANRAT